MTPKDLGIPNILGGESGHQSWSPWHQQREHPMKSTTGEQPTPTDSGWRAIPVLSLSTHEFLSFYVPQLPLDGFPTHEMGNVTVPSL